MPNEQCDLFGFKGGGLRQSSLVFYFHLLKSIQSNFEWIFLLKHDL